MDLLALAVAPAVRMVGAVAVSELSHGIATRDTMPATWTETREALARMEPGALVLDARRVLFIAAAEDLNSLFADADPEHDLPAALLVTEDVSQVFREHAWAMALRGFMRRVFTDERQAMEWARLRAGLRHHPVSP